MADEFENLELQEHEPNEFNDEPIDDAELEVEVDETLDTEPEGEEVVGTQQAAKVAAPVAPPADEPEANDAELDALPTKFKKRLGREIRLREQIRTEREQVKAAALQVARIAKAREDETVHLKRQNAALQKQFADAMDYAFERDIVLKSGELKRAREDGNYDEEIAAQSKLNDLQYKHNQLRGIRSQLIEPESISAPTPLNLPPPARPQVRTAQQQQQQQANKPSIPAPRAIAWLENNKAWFGDNKFNAQRVFAIGVDAELARNGVDKNSPEYYRMLDQRIDEAFPTLRSRRSAGSSPVAPAGAAARGQSSKVVKLGKTDISNMRMFGLDPSNKEHLREYARSKRTA